MKLRWLNTYSDHLFQLPGKKYLPFFLVLFFLLFSGETVFGQQAKLMFTFGHTRGVSYALYSPDGKKIVTASKDKTGKIWDAATGNVLADLKGNLSWIYTEDFSPDGKRLVTASFDSTAKIWDINTGELLHNLTGHKSEVWGAYYSNDGKKIATCSRDSTAILWNAQTGKPLIQLTGHTGFIQNLGFSPDDKKLVTASYDHTAMVWDTKTGKPLAVLKGHHDSVYSAAFSHNGKYIVTTSSDSTAKVWDVSSGEMLFDLKGHSGEVWMAQFSKDDKKIVTASFDGSAKLWNTVTGKKIHDFLGHKGPVWYVKFSPDNKIIVTASDDSTVKIWDLASGSLIKDIRAHDAQVRTVCFSPDGEKIVTGSDDKTAKIWEVKTGKLYLNLKGYASGLWSVKISPDGSKIVTASGDNTAKIWDIREGKIMYELKGHSEKVNAALFSPDGNKIVTISDDRSAKIWDAANGNFIADLKKHTGKLTAVQFSADGKLLATGAEDNTIKIWSVENGIYLRDCMGDTSAILSIRFSQDGKKLLTTSRDGMAKTWNVATGERLLSLKIREHSTFPGIYRQYTAEFNANATKVVTTDFYDDFSPKVWDANTGMEMAKLKGHTDRVSSAKFSPDGKKIITASYDKTARIWDAHTGQFLKLLAGHTFGLKSAEFTKDGKKIITASRDNSAKVWDAATEVEIVNLAERKTASWLNGEVESTDLSNNGEIIVTASGKTAISLWNSTSGELLYTFFTVGSGSDYLVVDKEGHFDGTEAARKMLYFTCGTEIISLNQVKDKLWSPDLAGRIIRNDSITDLKLSDLDICSYTPEVEMLDKGKNDYRFKITPRKGGLGESVLYLNGMEVKRYVPAQLKKEKGAYYLTVEDAILADKYTTDKENEVMLRSFVADNDISSRGIIFGVKVLKKDSSAPNLYALMIGVSKYKGDDLSLKFPAKDARDLASAIQLSASKFFDSQHVHIYDLTTHKDHYKNPGKNDIRQTIAEVGRKAKPNDILLIFFAGHGVTGDAKKMLSGKQFYFLTADASVASLGNAVADVGISTEELTSWINPSVMKAQKRVLIYDACNSGNVISDMQNQPGSFNIRNDDKSQQIRAIDKLNEQSGFIILSASANDQPAYEMSKYGHGLLTYALLRAIKLRPDILEDGVYLDVNRWFNAGKDAVVELSKENNTRQQPQLLSNNNFAIGKVDEQVMASIKLARESPVFAGSSFQNNNDSIADDDLGLGNYVNAQLNEIASRGLTEDIIFSSGSKDPDAWTMGGRYDVEQEDILIKKINLRQRGVVKYHFNVTGKKSDLKALAADIVTQATALILKNRTN